MDYSGLREPNGDWCEGFSWFESTKKPETHDILLGGSSHLVSGLVHPSYKWTLPPLIPFITRVVTHLRFAG